MAEKRRHTRRKLDAEVGYKHEKMHTFGGCIAKDVSIGGVCLRIKEFFPLGSILDLQFKLPLTDTAIDVKGKVVWINRLPYSDLWEIGVELTVDSTYIQLVEKYIRLSKS